MTPKRVVGAMPALWVVLRSQSKGPRGHVHEEFADFHTQTCVECAQSVKRRNGETESSGSPVTGSLT